MGAYLSKPNCEKASEDSDGEFMRFGASSMQGWRISQEDAHCCMIDFDESTGTSLFAVYDGHGGAEVAQYTAEHFPGFLKTAKPYVESKLAVALEEAFLGFDATLTGEDVKKKLAEMAGGDNQENTKEDDEDEKAEAAMLREEASMPIEELLERFGGANTMVNRPITVIKRAAAKNNLSPLLRSKPNLLPDGSDDNQPETESPESDRSICVKLADSLTNGCLQKDLHETGDAVKTESNSGDNVLGNSSKCVIDPNGKSAEIITDAKLTEVTVPLDVKDNETQSSSSSKQLVSADAESSSNGKESNSQTVCKAEASCNSSSNATVSSSSEDGVSVSAKASQPPQMSSSTCSEAVTGSSSSSGCKVDGESSEEDTPNEDDSEDEQWKEDEDDDDDSDEEGVAGETVFGELDEDDSSEEDSDGEDCDDDDEDMEGGMEFGDEPGADSGCTAVVALLRGNELYVANAGDSRCVLCRDGKAVEMSVDHKPEDQPEKDRIVRAGGRVTCDGRVNGGLNLSRAIGDHIYKRNTEVSDREQMITALPDVRSLTLDERDQFMVLACDGIWNVMSSQDVVDFVKRRLESGVTKLSAICEEMFEFCLAPDTTGDGTGCDNMTCVIVTFDGLTSSVCKRSGLKRKASDSLSEMHANDEFETAPKRPKDESD